MLFLRSHDTLSLFLHYIMTCMHISKKYDEIHGGRTNLTIRKYAKKTNHPLTNFRPKTLDSTDTVDFTHFRHTVNRYCVNSSFILLGVIGCVLCRYGSIHMCATSVKSL